VFCEYEKEVKQVELMFKELTREEQGQPLLPPWF